MAELASGAVSSLLGLLRNEALLLSGVGSDMEFIKEEMESMHSFLEHLSRTASPAGGHDEQVRTWMNQVRDLARDCSNFIDLHHRRGDIAMYCATGRRYLWWADWLVQKVLAQHQAAKRLRELKERARDVGKRRLRYDVTIPKKGDVAESSASLLSSSQGPAAGAGLATSQGDGGGDGSDDDEDVQSNQQVAVAEVGSHLLEPPLLEEFCAEKLAASWLEWQHRHIKMGYIAIVTPEDTEHVGTIARESLALAAKAAHFDAEVHVDLPAVHFSWDRPLLPSEILCYILRACEGGAKKEDRWDAYIYKDNLIDKTTDTVEEMGLDEKIDGIKSRIGVGMNITDEKRKVRETMITMSIFVSALARPEERLSEEDVDGVAWKLQMHMEQGGPQIRLDITQYRDILKKVFPTTESKAPQPVAQQEPTRLGDDHIKKIIENQKITLGIIWELLHKAHLLGGNSTIEQAQCIQPQGGADHVPNSTAQPQGGPHTLPDSSQVANSVSATVASIEDAMKRMRISGEDKAGNGDDAAINETREKMDEILRQIKSNMLIKGIVDKINKCLENKKTLIVLHDDEDYVSQWEETMCTLNLLGCGDGSAVIVTTKNTQKAKQFCNPQGEPITCSLTGFYYDIVHQLTHMQVWNHQILRDILDKCHPDEFCMKIFARALYANPKRSHDELTKLREDLAAEKTMGSDAKRMKMRMIKFSYRDLTREYKSCLLYLAIFPQGHNIRRSTLIGRWVTEGLITKQDWRTAVHHAEQCFDALIKRGLILPCHVAAAGKVMSCMVDGHVHVFITKIADKQHILDARLSDLWARHFSIFSGLLLRSSDNITKFVQKLPKYSSPQLSLLKVLDLEGIYCFEKNHYLRDICNKILLLKYLSLRKTNVRHLPYEINNLHELEVLDIRQTMVPENATRHVLLPKLRRFMADCIVDPRRIDDKTSRCAVQIPGKIEKMEKLEVLSNVRASQSGSDLKDIRNLWQLRKLGVVIQDNNNHLCKLLRVVNDLKACLESLSVTISKTRSKGTSSKKDKELEDMERASKETSGKLISLTINGFTERVELLDYLAKCSDELATVNLRGTLLKQENLKDALAVLPKLRYLCLQYGAYNDNKLTFKKEEFTHLKYFLFGDIISMAETKENMPKTEIEFDPGAAVELEKIVLSFTNISSLGGIDNLPKLKELELEGNEFLHSFSQGAPEQNTESIGLEQSSGLEQNNENIALKQDNESRTPGQSSRAPEERNCSGLEQNNENISLKQDNESRTPGKSSTSEERSFTFKKEKFKNLKHFRLEDSKMTSIIFEDGAAPELKKMVLSLTNAGSQLTVNSDLRKLKEIELRGGKSLFLTLFKQASRIAKVTLRETQLNQEDIQILAKKTNLCCLVLLDKSYDQSHLAFNKGDFPKLEVLIVDCSNINSISFTRESVPLLKKIVWSFTKIKSLSGIGDLPNLKEIECNGEFVPHQVKEDTATHTGKPVLRHKKPPQQDEKETKSKAEGQGR
ncbi:unnamed protein product [Urochloa humidicola]